MTAQLSLLALTDQTSRDFDRVLRSWPLGAPFTVNDLRPYLDAADIPEKARGVLFNAACRRGVIERATVDVDGQRFLLSRPSSGESAKGHAVSVYRRRAA